MYVSLPQGGHYVSFVYCRFTQSHTLYQSAHKYNIYYIYIINAETHRNPPKPTETHRNPLKPTYTNLYPPKPTQAQRDPFAMLYLCIVIHGKCAQSRTHPEGLAL